MQRKKKINRIGSSLSSAHTIRPYIICPHKSMYILPSCEQICYFVCLDESGGSSTSDAEGIRKMWRAENLSLKLASLDQHYRSAVDQRPTPPSTQLVSKMFRPDPTPAWKAAGFSSAAERDAAKAEGYTSAAERDAAKAEGVFERGGSLGIWCHGEFAYRSALTIGRAVKYQCPR